MTTAVAPRAGRKEWLGLGVLTMACLLYAMDLTVLHLAIPTISADLQPSGSELLWIIDIYGFMVAGALITMGTLGDRIGRRRLLLIGAVAFGAVSVIAAFSTSPTMLIASRALMGLAGATIAPATLSLIFNMFQDPAQRSRAVGIWITAFSTGGAVGLAVGGVLLEYFWWGSVFLMAVPVMIALLVLGPRVLPEYRDPEAGALDLPSAVMSLTALLAIVFGLKELAVDGLEFLTLFPITSGAFLGWFFWRRQRRLVNPLIDVSLFHNRVFNVSLLTNLLGIFVAFGFFLFVAQYLQLVVGLSPQTAGIWSLPSAAGFIVGANVAPRFIHQIRPVWVLAPALVVTAAGLALFTGAGVTNGLMAAVTGSVVVALALSPLFSLTTELIVGSAAPEKAGAASGIAETAAELGGALGIAVLGSIGAAVYRANLAPSIPNDLPADVGVAAMDSLGGAVETAGTIGPHLGDALVNAARHAFVDGLHVTTGITAVVALVVAAALVVLLRDVPARGSETTADHPHGSVPMDRLATGESPA